VRTLNALRAFSPAARLVLAHVSKADAERRDGARPFGSVFTWNLSRSVWEIRRDQESDLGQLTMALTHRKNNTGRRHEPIGLRFAFGSDTITPYPVDLGAKPQLAPSTSLAWRLRVKLASGRLSAAALAESLDAEQETVSRTLRRLRKDKKVRDFEDGTWGLADTVSALSGHSIRSAVGGGSS
jgi:DNA-binding transcriptional ArsR family regulator